MFVQDYRASKILYNFLMSNNIKGRFLLPANVCAIVPLVFHYANVEFDFVDIQNDNLCIDQQQILDKTKDYAGVLFVRTYGTEINFENFFKSIKEQNQQFIIIDDCCLCLPNIDCQLSENVDLKLYSIGYAKQVDLKIGAFGFIRNDFFYKEINTNYNSSDYDRYQNELKKGIDGKAIFIPVHYDFLDNQTFNLNVEMLFEKIDSVITHKNNLNNIYQNQLPTSIQFDSEFQQWRFNIFVNVHKKDIILKKLFDEKLFASSHYLSLSNVWKNQECPNATGLSKQVINLFNDLYYTEENALATCKIINQNI